MRTLAFLALCPTLLATAATAQDLSVASVDPYSLEAAEQGPKLPALGEFRVEYSRRKADFETAMPEVKAEDWKPPKPEWFDPSLTIAGGGKLKPDIKHRGLKVAFQIFDADDVDDDEPNPN